MSIFRSYFQKNNTIIKDNLTNNSQNPVPELFYGTPEGIFSRYIFKVDLTTLAQKIADEDIIYGKVSKHELNITNTIAIRPDLVGSYMADLVTRRASSFQVILFTLTEDWDEGNGYNFIYQDDLILNNLTGASNFTWRKTNLEWTVPGAYVSTGYTGMTSGYSQIIGSQSFDKGNENVKVDITSYINKILYSGVTDYGLGLAFIPALEAIKSEERFSFGMFGKYTNTYFEPYVETTFDDIYLDDRKYFYLDKTNDLFLVTKKGSNMEDISVDSVTILNDSGDLVQYIDGATGVTKVKTGLYRISVSVDSDTFPDAVIFNDVWNIVDSSGKNKQIEQNFYLKSQDGYYRYNSIDRVTTDNISFTYVGIKSGEIIRRGETRRIVVDYKQLYDVEDNPYDIEYRIFTKQGGNVDIVVVDFTKVNRILDRYEFTLDTSWLIPEEYHLELKISNNGVFMVKNPIKFRIQSEIQNFTIV